jgi:ribosomal protein L11 methyltransferase
LDRSLDRDAWATVRLTLRGPFPAADGDSRAGLLAAIDRLESVAALLAERDDVGGVETRDPFAIAEGPDFRPVEHPELVAYTTPESRAAVEQAALELAAELALSVACESSVHEGDDWRDAWKRHYRPLFVRAGATKLLIRPSWIERTPDDPLLELILDPGRAFGTGLHESTRLCLQLLVELADSARSDPSRVLDLGCGSGILGLAALRLFPRLREGTEARVMLVDHDPEATETARENAVLNGLADRVDTREAELGEKGASVPLAGPYPLVLANIRPAVLIPAARIITELLEPGAFLLLSGILDEEGEQVRAAYPELTLVDTAHENGWVALRLQLESGLRSRAGEDT